MISALIVFSALLASLSADSPAQDPLTRAIPPASPAWLDERRPTRIYGETYYVGTGGLSIVLIATDDGLVLIDGGLPQTVSRVEANIAALGFRIQDVRLILSTEAHFDHSGGLAALARDSGATVVASADTAKALQRGAVNADDPQASDLPTFPPVERLRVVADGEDIELGGTVIKAVSTPGHTLGSTSWTWRTCEQNACKTVVFAASLNAYATPPFRYIDHPVTVQALRASIQTVLSLDCDILISAHPDNSGLPEKLDALAAGNVSPMLAPGACPAYADRAQARLEARLARERDQIH